MRLKSNIKQWMSTKAWITGFAPMTPARFQERVKRGHQNMPDGLVLKFTHRSDEEIVVKLQEKIFLQQAAKRKSLFARKLPEAELLILAESLPHLVNLETLEFFDLDITETAAVALIAGLKPLRHLKELMFLDGCDIEATAAKVMANGFLQCQFDGELKVGAWNGSGTEKLAKELRSFWGTGRVVHQHFWPKLVLCDDLRNACFTIKAAAGVEEGSKLGWFRRQLAKFSSCKKRATDPPHATLDDAHVVAHV